MTRDGNRWLMRFNQLDRITELEPGHHLKATKCLSLSEQYLHDHFPLFPVMPGVLMLEALYQAASWLIRSSEDFANSMVVLHEARNIKFQDFVSPGNQLDVYVEILKQNDREVHVKAIGTIGDKTAVNGRLVLHRFNLENEYGEPAEVDKTVGGSHQKIFRLLSAGLKTSETAETTAG